MRLVKAIHELQMLFIEGGMSETDIRRVVLEFADAKKRGRAMEIIVKSPKMITHDNSFATQNLVKSIQINGTPVEAKIEDSLNPHWNDITKHHSTIIYVPQAAWWNLWMATPRRIAVRVAYHSPMVVVIDDIKVIACE